MNSVSFLQNQSAIVFINKSNELKVWNFIEKKITHNINTGYEHFCLLVKKSQTAFIIGSRSIIFTHSLDQPQPNNLAGHGDTVSCIVLTDDEKTLASGSKDSLIIIWDLSLNRIKFNLRGSTGAINSVSLTSDEKHLISASSDQTVRLWSMENGIQIKLFNNLSSEILCILKLKQDFLLLSNNSNISYFTTNDNSIQMTKLLKSYSVGSETSAFEKKFLGYGNDQIAVIWDLKNEREKFILKSHDSKILCVEICFDQNFVLTCSEGIDKNLLFWDLKTCKCIGEFKGHTGSVLCACFSIDKIHGASGSFDKSVRLWNLETCIQAYEFKGHSGCVNSVIFMTNKEMLVSGGSEGNILIWNLVNKTQHASLAGNSVIKKILMTENNKFIISCFSGGTIQFWNTQGFKCEGKFDKEAQAKNWLKENKISKKLVKRYLKL